MDTSKEEIIPNKHLLPYASRTLDPAIRLVDRALEIENASQMLQGHVHGKLELIQTQIRNLQKQAQKILSDSTSDLELHKVKCNFEKKTGQQIYLYNKGDANKKQLYFSLLSPADWNNRAPHNFEGAYELQADQSFKKV